MIPAFYQGCNVGGRALARLLARVQVTGLDFSEAMLVIARERLAGQTTANSPKKADFVLGDRDGSTCAPEFTAFVAKTLTGLGYDVAINDPYKGVELVRMHGRPAEQRHSLQIEINRRLYMDESTLARHSGFDTLRSNLQRLLEALRQFVIDRTASRA